jgi:DNA-directed RNA polymerase specialized sigma24 family protein
MTDDDSISTSKTAEKFVVRLPHGMRRRIAEVARLYRRSMNSEIVARLEHSLEQEDSFLDPPPPGANEPVAETLAVAEEPAPEDQERRLLALFRALPPERRRALLLLLD